MQHHLRTLLATVMIAPVMAGCNAGRQVDSYSPVFASSFYGDRTQDGAILTLDMSKDEAMEFVDGSLRSAGYELRDLDNRGRRIASISVEGAVMTVTVEAAEVKGLDESIIMLTAIQQSAAPGSRPVPVIQKPGEADPLFARLQSLADEISQRHMAGTGKAPGIGSLF